ncbi:hypothetical protein LguiA_004644 [Lonicera macranthoides]
MARQCPILHCDLKPGNVLLDKDMIRHVCDFGIAKLLGEDEFMAQTKTLATTGYMALEYGREGMVSTKGDVYNYGILLIETFSRKKPIDEMFSDKLIMRSWVYGASLGPIVQVVDTNWIGRGDEDFLAKNECIVMLNWFSKSPMRKRRMMGKELEGLSFKELQHLEHQLNECILSFKDKKIEELNHAAQHYAISCFQLPGKVQVVIADQKEIVIRTHFYAWPTKFLRPTKLVMLWKSLQSRHKKPFVTVFHPSQKAFFLVEEERKKDTQMRSYKNTRKLSEIENRRSLMNTVDRTFCCCRSSVENTTPLRYPHTNEIRSLLGRATQARLDTLLAARELFDLNQPNPNPTHNQG